MASRRVNLEVRPSAFYNHPGFRVEGSGFRVYSHSTVEGSGFRVQG